MKRLSPAILSFHSSVERFCGGQGVMDLAHGARDGLCVSQYLFIHSLMEPLLYLCIKTMVMKVVDFMSCTLTPYRRGPTRSPLEG